MSKVQLKDIASFSKGSQINGDKLIKNGAYDYLNGGISPSGKWNEYNVLGDSITISEGGNSCGYVNYMVNPFWCGAHCYYLFDLKCNKKYLYYALKSQQEKIMKLRSGACMPNIKKSDIGNFVFEFDGDINFQKQIAENLDKVTRTIELCNAILEKLDLLVKARFVEMFGDIIYNTKQWDVYVFSDITTSRLGKMLDTKHQTGNSSFPYLANFNVQWFRFELNNLNKMDFDKKEQKEFDLKDGDLLVCEGGEIGRCAIWHNNIKPCYFQKALHRVRCKKEYVLPIYLAWWFKFNCDNNGFGEIEGAKATIAHLPGAKLKKLNVVVPPLQIQNQFADFVTQIEKTKSKVKQTLEKAETLKKALMQKYFG